MKSGDRVRCSTCGEMTVVRTAVVMDGWTRKNDILVCGICGQKLGEAEPAAAENAPHGDDRRRNALSALLGAEEEVAPKLELKPEERRFCRDCRYFIIHPFASHCDRFPERNDPMADCEFFERKPEK